MCKGLLFVISAPSGAGKSTLIAGVRSVFPDMVYSISCTTRQPREGEVDGVDYYFLSEQEFEEMVKTGQFLEWKMVHGNLYGTPISPVKKAISESKKMILDIDVQGAKEVFTKIPEAVGIFITAPSLEILEQRLRARGTDSEETIRTRLANATREMEMAKMFRYLIINDNLEKALAELVFIIKSYDC